MKGTAVLSGTDIDLFISISETCTETLSDIYEKLFRRLSDEHYSPKKQNVSINIKLGGFHVDLVPAKRQNSNTSDHSLYCSRSGTWQKTNVQTHISHVVNSGRQMETRIIKLWRNQKNIDFPSFYLELVVIKALSGWAINTSLDDRVWAVFRYLRDYFPAARFVDPANTNNIISNDLTAIEKNAVTSAACKAIAATNWGEIVK